MRHLITLALTLSLVPLIARTERAALTGVVMDPSRSVIPGAKVSFRADVFNHLNRAQIGKPNVKWTDPKSGTTYGAITSPLRPRQSALGRRGRCS